MSNSFITLSGYINMAAGMLLLIYWYAFAIFLPYGALSNSLSLLVNNRNWTWINATGVLGALAGLLGQAGIFLFQEPQNTIFGSIGFFVAVTGTTLLIGTMLWETILWPILVPHDDSLLDFQGVIYTSRTFLPFFIVAGLIYSAGYILVGVGVIRAGVFPYLPGYLLAVGAPSFGLGSLFGKLQVYPRSLGITLMSGSLIWLGIIMVSP